MTRKAPAVAALILGVLTLTALTACSGAAPPPPTAGNPFTAGPSASGAGGSSAVGGSSATSGPAAGGSATGPAAGGLSAATAACKQAYDVWQQGPGQGLVPALTAFGQAVTTADLTAALTRAKPTLARASRTPMPQCADPRGYWMVLVMHVNAAAASTSSKSSMKTAMKGVPAIAQALLTELHQTAAVALSPGQQPAGSHPSVSIAQSIPLERVNCAIDTP